MDRADENADAHDWDWEHFFQGFDNDFGNVGDGNDAGATQARHAHNLHTFPHASASNQDHYTTVDGPPSHRASTHQDQFDEFLLHNLAYDTEPPSLAGTPAVRPRGRMMNFAGEPVFVPDSPDPDGSSVPVHQHIATTTAATTEGHFLSNPPVFTVDDCLKQVQILFPDVCHEHVHKLFYACDEDGDYEQLPPAARLESIIEQLATGTAYPKQRKGKLAEKKRKRADSEDKDPTKAFEDPRRESVTQALSAMRAILKVEFPEIPQSHIVKELHRHKHLYQTYVSLATAKDTNNASDLPYGRGRPGRYQPNDATDIARDSRRPELAAELRAARIRVRALRDKRAASEERKMAEQKNLEQAIAANDMAECQACFEELPANRQIHCDGEVAHFTCYECAETYIKAEVGDARCRVLCTAGCGAGFKPSQLNQLSDKGLLEKLAQLQQEKDIRDAGLEDLEECPFCDYKAIVPPIEEDFEFRCENPNCALVSCRRCKSVSHIPFSCEVHAKENKLNNRHKVEEAMTSAMIRHCNKCKKPFFKEGGCNKMTCPSCGNLQCYVCSKSIEDYNHFNEGNPRAGNKNKRCPLQDDVNARHEREVKEAEVAARAEVIAQNPQVSEEDLEIKVSDAVKRDSLNQLRAAQVLRHRANVVQPWLAGPINYFHNQLNPAMYAGNINNNHGNNNNNNINNNNNGGNNNNNGDNNGGMNNNNYNNNVVAPPPQYAGNINVAVPPIPPPEPQHAVPLGHHPFELAPADWYPPDLPFNRFAYNVPRLLLGNGLGQYANVAGMGQLPQNQGVANHARIMPRGMPPEMFLPQEFQQPANHRHAMPQMPQDFAEPEDMDGHDGMNRW